MSLFLPLPRFPSHVFRLSLFLGGEVKKDQVRLELCALCV